MVVNALRPPGSRLTRPDVEGGDVPRPNDAKVALIERRDLWLVKSFGQRNYACVDQPEVQIAIPVLQLAAAVEINVGWRFHPISAAADIVKKDQPRVNGQSLGAPVVEFCQDQDWHDQIVGCSGDEFRASPVIRIGGIQSRQDRSGVEDQRHLTRGSRHGLRCDFRCPLAVG